MSDRHALGHGAERIRYVSRMSRKFLKVEGDSVVDSDGTTVVLRGLGLGGWMNMENFITGYPANESAMRAAVGAVLGAERAERFFDRLLDAFFTRRGRAGARRAGHELRAAAGQPAPLRARRRAVRAGGEGLRAPGRGDPGVRGGRAVRRDRPARRARLPEPALAFGQPDARRRLLAAPALPGPRRAPVARARRALPRRARRGRLQPAQRARRPERAVVGPFHDRLVAAVREVDPEHIVFVDGNTYSTDFSAFSEPYPNAIYACHDYARAGHGLRRPVPGRDGRHVDRSRRAGGDVPGAHRVHARDRHADLGRRVRTGLHRRSRARRDALPGAGRPARALRAPRRRLVAVDLQGRRPPGPRDGRCRQPVHARASAT